MQRLQKANTKYISPLIFSWFGFMFQNKEATAETVFADVTADCDCCKTRRKDAGGVWGQGGQVWDDYRVSIHVINLRMFAHVGILIPWVVGNLPSGIAHTENKVYTIIGTRN